MPESNILQQEEEKEEEENGEGREK